MNKCAEQLLEKSNELFVKQKALVHFVDDERQNKFLNDLENYPHAFVLACLMDRQIKAERAWVIPYAVFSELGSFEISTLKGKGREFYKQFFNDKKLHRFNDTQADIFYDGVCRIADKYDGKADKIWQNSPSSAKIVYEFLQFKGCGVKIATMAANILARQFKIKMSDFYSIDISPDVHIKRLMYRLGFVKKGATTDEIIYKARELNPKFPGLIDFACWKLGREFCDNNFKKCKCDKCFMGDVCPRNP